MEKKVIIYSTPTCHFCHMAKDFFTEKNIPFTDYNIVADGAKREEMIQLTGQLGVPVILIDNEVFTGFDREKLTAKLGIA